jgi:glycosyltransferase involved in cell wall biosynthesis
VVPDFSHLAGPPNYMQAGAFDDEWVNVLFVGRMIPNKRIEDVIRIFHAYKQWFNPCSRLLLVGAQGGFEKYAAMLHQFIDRLGTDDVHFMGHVSNEELAAYYELADVFLCASEHEGFCVPLVEAFHMGVPVVAHAAAAVPATLDGAGVLYTGKDPVQVAAIVDRLATDRDVSAKVVDAQDAALDRLLAKDFGGLLLRFVEGLRAAPRRPHPPVAPDFWDQVRWSEELAAIREYRPGAFRGLPIDRGEGHEGGEGREGHEGREG